MQIEGRPEESSVHQVPVSVEGSNPVPSPDHDGVDAGRWDHDKAETMAGAVKAAGMFDYYAEQRDNLRKDADELVDQATHQQKADLDHWEQDQARAGNRSEEGARILERQREEYDLAQKQARSAIEKTIEHKNQQMDAEAERVISSHEELYDTNPERFASMPTGEFMELAEQLQGYDRTIESDTAQLLRLATYMREVDASLESRKPLPRETVGRIVWQQTLYGLNDSEQQETKARIGETFDDTFDRSPHQIADAVKAELESQIARVEGLKAAAEHEKQQFIDSQRPHPDGTPTGGETQNEHKAGTEPAPATADSDLDHEQRAAA